jgi:hypothetical protein
MEPIKGRKTYTRSCFVGFFLRLVFKEPLDGGEREGEV